MTETTSGDSSFHPIAEREFQLRGRTLFERR
jgi:hypothetical protein